MSSELSTVSSSIELSKVWFSGVNMKKCICQNIEDGMRQIYDDFVSLNEISGGSFSTVVKLKQKKKNMQLRYLNLTILKKT